MVTKASLKTSNLYVWLMCLLRLSELYCVSTKIRRSPELMQFEMGMSTSRYLPASGTAGLARSLVSGNKRVPRPPPRITESTLLVCAVWRLVYAITKPLFLSLSSCG